jgi:hypothetical protein
MRSLATVDDTVEVDFLYYMAIKLMYKNNVVRL